MARCCRGRYTAGMKPIRALIFFLVSLVVLTAQAQWQWLDKDGRRVFSDLPPPAEIPEKNVLRKPGSRDQSSPAPMAAPAPAAAATAAPAAGTDKSLQEKLKQAEAAEAAKVKAEEERMARARTENCTRATQAKAGLDAGGRMSRLNEKGEREFFDDAMRAAEGERLQTIINSDCR